MRDTLDIVSYSKIIDLQMQKYITTISLKLQALGY